MTKTDPHMLAGKMLIAMPGLEDTRFEASVIYLCAHSEEGAMGLIINKASKSIGIDDVFGQLELNKSEAMSPMSVHYGGPVETGRGFVLHSSDYAQSDASMAVTEQISMTASRDILSDISSGEGPKSRLLCLGYAGWEPLQLESEISQNAWLVCDGDFDLIFDTDDDMKWTASLQSLGVQPAMLSGESGRA